MRFITLSDKFFDAYAGCKEILQKRNRPYVCVEIKMGNWTYAVPFRHHISHKYAFFTVGNSGLDYTKAIPIVEDWFVSPFSGSIEQAEYDALRGKEHKVAHGMESYVALYRKARSQSGNAHYASVVKFSALQHFDKYI